MKREIRKFLKVKNKQIIGYHRYPFNFLRSYPEFIIIGSQKAASTTLHHYLTLNSKVQSPLRKEAQFFNMNYDRGLSYYKSIFPIKKKGMVTFESTPDYLSHPLAPELCHNTLPNLKIIVTLRNPIDRAYSHFNFIKGYGGENLETTFEEALILEDSRIKEALELMKYDKYQSAVALARYGYKRNGEYANHINNWLKYYPLENFCFVDFNEIKIKPNLVMKNLCDFLNLPHEMVDQQIIKNKTKYEVKINIETYNNLVLYYKDHNAVLFSLIKKELKW